MCNNIKVKIEKYKLKKERGEKGYSYQDVWNTDLYLLKLISEMLNELAAVTMAYPPEMSYEEWIKFLKTLSKDFKSLYLEVDLMEYKENFKERFEYAMSRLTKHFFDFWY